MKPLQYLLFSILMSIAVQANALDQDMQVDLQMAKINTALKANRPADAVPYFAQLESIEPQLKHPLPESFYFSYIDTLDKAGDRDNALKRSDAYLNKYGKNAAHYSQVIEIMSRLQMGQDKDAIEADKTKNREAQASKDNHQHTLSEMHACKDEAIALEKVFNGLTADQEGLKKRWSYLELQRTTLESRDSSLSMTPVAMPMVEQQLRDDWRTYDHSVHEIKEAGNEYAADKQNYEARLGRYTNRCVQIQASNADVDEVCRDSVDSFCNKFR